MKTVSVHWWGLCRQLARGQLVQGRVTPQLAVRSCQQALPQACAASRHPFHQPRFTEKSHFHAVLRTALAPVLPPAGALQLCSEKPRQESP